MIGSEKMNFQLSVTISVIGFGCCNIFCYDDNYCILCLNTVLIMYNSVCSASRGFHNREGAHSSDEFVHVSLV